MKLVRGGKQVINVNYNNSTAIPCNSLGSSGCFSSAQVYMYVLKSQQREWSLLFLLGKKSFQQRNCMEVAMKKVHNLALHPKLRKVFSLISHLTFAFFSKECSQYIMKKDHKYPVLSIQRAKHATKKTPECHTLFRKRRKEKIYMEIYIG